jgi:Ni,Fe-hydrogenase III component G
MTDQELTEKLKAVLGEKIVEISNPARRRVFMTVEVKNLEAVMTGLRKDFGYTYLATVSGVDKGEVYEIVYHLGDAHGNLNVRTQIPKADPRLPSICAVIPGAVLYERELQDMFGIVVDRIPDPRPLVMPDDWPAGHFPLRKDWKFDRPQEIIPGGKK